jgi:hypothetical protein
MVSLPSNTFCICIVSGLSFSGVLAVSRPFSYVQSAEHEQASEDQKEEEKETKRKSNGGKQRKRCTHRHTLPQRHTLRSARLDSQRAPPFSLRFPSSLFSPSTPAYMPTRNLIILGGATPSCRLSRCRQDSKPGGWGKEGRCYKKLTIPVPV